MKHFVLALLLLLTCAAHAQSSTDTCAAVQHPHDFDGKTVTIKGKVIAGFDYFAVQPEGCGEAVMPIWLVYPAGSHTKAGPAVVVTFTVAAKNPAQPFALSARAPVMLSKDAAFKAFDTALSTPAKTKGTCLGCTRSTVTATLTGRLDAVEQTGIVYGADGKLKSVRGFGHMNAYATRLVISQIADVVPQEIAYPAKQVPAAATPFRPIDVRQVKAAVDALGTPGDDNGVLLSFSDLNEEIDPGLRATNTSPDGAVMDVRVNMKGLGDALPLAIFAIGSNIADVRGRHNSMPSLYDLEQRGYALASFGAKGKDVMLPGGYIISGKKITDDELDAAIAGALAWMRIPKR